MLFIFKKFGLGVVKDIKDDCYVVDFHKYGIKKIVRESYSYFLRKIDDKTSPKHISDSGNTRAALKWFDKFKDTI